MARLEWVDGEVLRVLKLSPVTRIGRAIGSDICLDNPVVSGTHARIDFNGQVSTVTNVSRSTPLWVNGIEYHNGDVVALEDGDTIKLPRFIDGEYNYYYFTYRAPQIWQLTGRFSTPAYGVHVPEEMMLGSLATRFRAEMAVQTLDGWEGGAPAATPLQEGARGRKREALGAAHGAAKEPRSDGQTSGFFTPFTAGWKGGGRTRKNQPQTPEQRAAEAQKQAETEARTKKRDARNAQLRLDSDAEAALHAARPPPPQVGSKRLPFTGRPIFTLVDGELTAFKMALPNDNMTATDARVTIIAMLSTYRVGDLVFEELWRQRGVSDSEPNLTPREQKAILSGDPTLVNHIRIQRWLWRVTQTVGYHDVTVDGEVWTLPTVVLQKCMKGVQEQTLRLDLVGKDFSKPYSAELADIATEFNLRLDARLTEEQQKSDVTWRLMWYKELCGSTEIGTANLNKWTRDMSDSGVHLLTEQAPRFMSALTWWAAVAPDAYDEDDEMGHVVYDIGYVPKKQRKHPKFERMLMVPRMISLTAMFKLSTLGTRPERPKDPHVDKATMFDNVQDPYKMLKKTGEQVVAMANFSSYLGSAAHMAAANMVVGRNPDIPTALENSGALNSFVVGREDMLHKIGMALYPSGDVAAVEFPVYWGTLALDNNFVGSRIDALTKNEDGSYDVWEFKTKWGLEGPVPMPHIRQAVLYCYMFVMQTRCEVRRFHLRYVRIVNHRIERTTYSYEFGEHLRPFLNQALARSGPWTHNRFTEAHPPEKPNVFRGKGVNAAWSRALCTYPQTARQTAH
jgi:hypothetical protein